MYSSKFLTPSKELETRIKKFQKHLAKQDVDGALIVQNTDIFYFSGTSQQAHLYIPVEGKPILMVRKDMGRAMEESALESILPLTSPRKIPDIIKECGGSISQKRIGMELDVLPYNLHKIYSSVFKDSEIVDVSHSIRMVRAVKSSYELEMIAKASAMSDKLAKKVPEILQEGMEEIELAGLIEAEARRLGHQGIVRMRLFGAELFYGHVMCGPSAAIPSYLASPTGGPGVSPAIAQGPGVGKIRKREPVLVDFVCVYNGYMSDYTRIFAIDGLSDDLLKAHQAMLDLQETIKGAAKPGVPAGDLYELGIDQAGKLGYEKNFMGSGEQRINFIGHGVGLELDEYPFIAKGQKLSLEQGMVIALEPKLIFPGIGVVGIENTHVVTNTGLKQFGVFQENVIAV